MVCSVSLPSRTEAARLLPRVPFLKDNGRAAIDALLARTFA
jgi:hypothetical protein